MVGRNVGGHGREEVSSLWRCYSVCHSYMTSFWWTFFLCNRSPGSPLHTCFSHAQSFLRVFSWYFLSNVCYVPILWRKSLSQASQSQASTQLIISSFCLTFFLEVTSQDIPLPPTFLPRIASQDIFLSIEPFFWYFFSIIVINEDYHPNTTPFVWYHFIHIFISCFMPSSFYVWRTWLFFCLLNNWLLLSLRARNVVDYFSFYNLWGGEVTIESDKFGNTNKDCRSSCPPFDLWKVHTKFL